MDKKKKKTLLEFTKGVRGIDRKTDFTPPNKVYALKTKPNRSKRRTETRKRIMETYSSGS